MSLINDALKQARQAPPRNTPNVLPLRPAAHQEPGVVAVWLLPVTILILVIAAIFFGGWMMAHRNVREIITAPDTSPTPEMVKAAAPAEPVKPAASEFPVSTIPENAPVLQGIFYSPTAPSAIIDGKTVRPGDRAGQYYRVKEITQFTVTLVGPDNKPFKIGLEH